MIDLTLTSEQAELARTVAQAAAKEFPPKHGVAAAVHGPPAFDAARWTRLASLGCFGVGVSADRGGLGLGAAEELLMMVELGRRCASGPFVGTVLACRAAASRGGDEALASMLMSGERRAGLLAGELAADAVDGLAVRVDRTGIALVEITSARPTLAADPLTALARVRATSTVLTVECAPALTRLRLLIGGYLVGLAEAATTMAADYAKTREQFGRPIGAFQAVKHRCAEMLIRSYPVHAQLAMGAALVDAGIESGPLEVAEGLLMALDGARRNAEDNVQIHGGIGFTAEHPAGVLVKRANTYRTLAGPENVLVADILAEERRRPE
jgi:alkylation response protein AidB-like acyl-CoA dehydrogenase